MDDNLNKAHSLDYASTKTSNIYDVIGWRFWVIATHGFCILLFIILAVLFSAGINRPALVVITKQMPWWRIVCLLWEQWNVSWLLSVLTDALALVAYMVYANRAAKDSMSVVMVIYIVVQSIVAVLLLLTYLGLVYGPPITFVGQSAISISQTRYIWDNAVLVEVGVLILPVSIMVLHTIQRHLVLSNNSRQAPVW